MKEISKRAELKQALEKSFLPKLKEKGFTGPTEKLSGNQLIYDYTLEKKNTHLTVSIQFEKYQLPRFVINFNEINEGAPYILNTDGRLQPKRGSGTGAWFRSDPKWGYCLLGYKKYIEASIVVENLLELFPQVELWWSEKSIGPNLIIHQNAKAEPVAAGQRR